MSGIMLCMFTVINGESLLAPLLIIESPRKGG